MRVDETYNMLKPPIIATRRYKNPANLAVLLIEIDSFEMFIIFS
jgi:hypothetical protein